MLPQVVVDFIKEKGFCSFHNGLFTMCNPEEMRAVTALVFGADDDFHHRDCHVFGYTAFGVLYCWSDKLYNFRIELPLIGPAHNGRPFFNIPASDHDLIYLFGQGQPRME